MLVTLYSGHGVNCRCIVQHWRTVLELVSSAVPYSISNIGHGADLGFLAVSPQVTLL